MMEFNEKLQELRKQKGMTQEELARALYVSRAAVSKWESGRGYPNIESLKAIAKFYSVSIDTLLSGEEVLSLAQEDSREKEHRFRSLVFGLLDCCTVLFFFLPFFGEEADGMIRAVSLLQLNSIGLHLKVAYWTVSLGMVLGGVWTLAHRWEGRYRISFLLHGLAVMLFIISRQPYAAAFLFLFLAMKGILFIKRR